MKAQPVTLADLLADPSTFADLSPKVQADLYEQVEVLAAQLRVKIMVRHRGDARTQTSEIVGRDEAAKHLRTTVGSLHKKHKRLRLGYIDPLDGRLKFTAAELEAYIRRQKRA